MTNIKKVNAACNQVRSELEELGLLYDDVPRQNRVTDKQNPIPWQSRICI